MNKKLGRSAKSGRFLVGRSSEKSDRLKQTVNQGRVSETVAGESAYRATHRIWRHGERAGQTVIVNDREVVLIDAVDFDELVALASHVDDEINIDLLDADDRDTVALANAVRRDSNEEFMSAVFADRIINGENQVRVWREYRGMTAGELAKTAGISQGYLSEIETGKKPGSVDKVKKIANALGVLIDDLVD